MAQNLTSTLLNFTRKTVGSYNVVDYTSINFFKVREYLDALPPEIFEFYQVDNTDRFERIALELYGNANYWDILMIINKRNPLTGLPFDFDFISNLSEDTILEYEAEIYKKTVPQVERDLMYTEYEKVLFTANEANRIIKIIKPSRLSEFLQNGFDAGIF